MSDDLFHLFVTYIRTQKWERRNTPYRAGRKMLQNSLPPMNANEEGAVVSIDVGISSSTAT